ncbi:MAG: ABC transporter permease [Vicinamibacterales bacterium]
MGVRLALARLLGAPMFTIFSILSLASGVAITTAVYSVVDTLMLPDSGITEPERAAFVVTPGSGRMQYGSLSDADFEHLRTSQQSFSSLSAAAAISPSVAAMSNAEVLSAEAVEGTYFPTLGVTAGHGRLLQPADDGARIAVLSDDYWHTDFAADVNVIGRTIRINGHAFEVVGIAPRTYRGLFGALRSTNVWIPLGAEAELGSNRAERDRLVIIGRLASGRTLTTASAELATISARLDREVPLRAAGTLGAPIARRWSARSVESMSTDDNSLRRFGMTLVGLVGLVLVVACTNLANLVLARGTARQGELAVRMAMGASRGRLIWEQCIESLILAALGTIASYVMFQLVSALITTDFVMRVPFGGTATLSIRPALNRSAITVALVSMLLSLAVFGLEPAVQLARTLDIRSALAAGATGIRPRVARQRMVIRWQVAIAAGFFIVATMFIRSTLSQARHDPGVDLDRLAVAVLSFENGAWDDERIRRTIDLIARDGQGDANIESISASTGLPFGVPALDAALARPDDVDALKRSAVVAVAATPSIFRTLGVEIVRGRRFNDTDGPAAPPAVILSELAARQFFSSGDPIGQHLAVRRPQHPDTTAIVVGVARDTDVRRIDADRRPLVYLPLAQNFARAITVVARSTRDGGAAIQVLRETIRKASPDLAVTALGTGDQILAGPFVLVRSLGLATLYLGGFTLLLSMVGLFGVQSHVVAHRTREIGVRMSVGATAGQIKLMILKDGYRPVIEGLVLGLWGGLAGRFMLRAYMDLEDVTIFDPWMLVLTPIPLMAAAFCASYWPAARAASVDPTVALRCE